MRTIRADEFYAARFWRRVDKAGECWMWTGPLTPEGYGVGLIRKDGQVIRLAHRAAYALANGDIPDGLHIDHLCRVRACVRPDHLEAVTQAENNRRIPGHLRGRRRKQPEDRYVTPARSFRPFPPELWDRVKAKAARNGETITDVLNQALDRYDREHPDPDDGEDHREQEGKR